MKSRDKRRRVKSRQLKNTVGVAVLPKAAEPVNGKFCQARRAMIDASVCTVQSTRAPHLCGGCAVSSER